MGSIKPKTPEASQGYIAEIVGDESLIGQRMYAGRLLHMMDFAAADAASRHAQSPLVTLSFDRIELLDYIYHRDHVRYEACVIKVGCSSLLVKVDGYVKSPTTMVIRPAHSGFITMVAIGENGRPNRNIPALAYQSPGDLENERLSEKRACMIRKRQKVLEDIKELDHVALDDLVDFYPRNQTFTPVQTRLSIRKRFLPRNANTLGIVFGGDTIQLMEELAVATARQFAGTVRMVTIAMEDVLFLKPLYVTDLVEMTAQVVFVGRTTVVVEISVMTLGGIGSNKSLKTNKGTFTVFNYGNDGRPIPIQNGLNLRDADQEIRKCYLKEQVKYDSRTGISGAVKGGC